MRREIGSEFWDVPTTNQQNRLFPESTQWYLSGRSALQAIIKELCAARSVSLPSWCCDSIIKPFIEAGLEVHFYPVTFDGCFMQDIKLDTEVLFLMDYFGYTTPFPDLSDYNGVIIRDVTHSIFSSTYYDADYYFGSLRKWCGVWSCGYAWTRDGRMLKKGEPDKGEYINLRSRAMEEKRDYIEGRCAEKKYLKIYDAAEECLETTGIVAADERDVESALRLDIENTIKPKEDDIEGPTNIDVIDPQDGEDTPPAQTGYPDNVMEIDFDNLIAHSDGKIKEMHEYFSNLTPTKQNKYTGMFKGYNLIWICAEGFSSWAIDKTHTPTLYRLANEGFVFKNFY